MNGLDRIAGERGWRLAWAEEPLLEADGMVMVTLDVFAGKRCLTIAGPLWTWTGARSVAAARERLARVVVDQVERRAA